MATTGAVRSPVTMAVMHVRNVRMRMSQRLVFVNMRVRFAGRARRGYLEIEILSGSNAEVPLIGPSKFILTIRGDLSPAGSITSLVHFRSLTDEFLREEGDVEVVGERAYRLHLNGARRVLQTLESSCMAVS